MIAARSEGAAAPHLAVGKDDTVWCGDYARGFLGHLDRERQVEEFSRRRAGQPCDRRDRRRRGLVHRDRRRDEEHARALQRNEEISDLGDSGGGGTGSNMEIDKQGNLWLAESGVSISRVTIKTTPATSARDHERHEIFFFSCFHEFHVSWFSYGAD